MSLKIKTPPKSGVTHCITTEEFNNMKVAATKKVAEKVLIQYMMLEIYEKPEVYHPEFVEMIKKLQSKNEKAENKLKKYILLTVNPNENSKYDWDILKFHHLIKKCVGKPWIHQYAYTIETRGEVSSDEEGNNLFHGIHAHILIDRGDYSPSHTLREIWSTFRKLFDTDLATKYTETIYSTPMFNYKSTDEYPSNFIKYIQGVKDGAPKANAKVDVLMRIDHDIDMYYMSGFGYTKQIEMEELSKSSDEDPNQPPSSPEQCLTDILDTDVVTTTTTNQQELNRGINAPLTQHQREQLRLKYAL